MRTSARVPALWGACLAVSVLAVRARAIPEDIVFPADSGIIDATAAPKAGPAGHGSPGRRIPLRSGWLLRSSVLVEEGGEEVSSIRCRTEGWLPVAVPSTVLSALVKGGVYPEPREGMNAYLIPDSSDEFNRSNDLERFSYLPDRRNPWRDPYWYRTGFDLPAPERGRRVWLHFDCINYRAEVWLNGTRIVGPDAMAGMFQRFDFDITAEAKAGANVLAVKVFPVDHPGVPDKQTEPLGKDRSYRKDNMEDVTMVMAIGYDCMPTVPDRNMGILQEVWVDSTGPVTIRHPFIACELPLPRTDRATLRISAELSNAAASPVKGRLRGRIPGTDVEFEQPMDLGPTEMREVAIAPGPVMQSPRLWWPRGQGEQALYDLVLAFETEGAISDEKTVAFGVRQVTSELHRRDGSHGRRVLINGRKVFCRGGYIQPEVMFDWDARRMEAEIRYFAQANLNLIYFEDIPNPPEALLEACDRLGVMFGQCCYACSWPTPGTNHPRDVDLLMRCTADFIKRYRNHPSLVMYMAQDEDDTRREVYEPWRKLVLGLDGTRFWIPSGYFPDSRKDVPAWIQPDLPSGMNDGNPKSYGWVEPVTYFDWVRSEGSWMFKIETGSASVPPISSLAKFIPDLGPRKTGYKPDAVWAHHDACHYFKPFDDALGWLHGEAVDAVDYAWKAHLLTADQHRAMFEAVNHRMWERTSGFTQWKINSCWPSVEWQVFDWYLKPMVSWYFIKRAGEPLHVQLNLPDSTVSVINHGPAPRPDLQVRARTFDLSAKLLWEKAAGVSAPASAYRESFTVPEPPAGSTPVYLVKLDLEDAGGRPISDNFYWLRARGVEDYKALQGLATVKLASSCAIEARGGEKLARAKVTNPTARLAFFIQLALTRVEAGEEILPVIWEDNYFSLLPGESREVAATFDPDDAGSAEPALEVGGWNVQTDFRCGKLEVSSREAKAGEPIDVTATVAGTFLDGSRVALEVDGVDAGYRWAWARGDKEARVPFEVRIDRPGRHRIRVADRTAEIVIPWSP